MAGSRLARREDNAAVLSLFNNVPMEGELVLKTQRDPEFFALYDMQRNVANDCWVYDDEGELTAMATALVRDGYLDGAPCRVGYLCDLRTRFSARKVRDRLAMVEGIFQRARDVHGCEVFLTSIIASNTAAVRALAARKSKRAWQPYYHLLRPFRLISIHFTRARKPEDHGFRVRRAETSDVPRLAALLAEDHRRRPFGYRFDDGELQHRLAKWPGMTLGNTYLAEDRGGQLVGCTTAWDPSMVKRYRVELYRGSMRWVKTGYNAVSRMLGYPTLPEPGEDFRQLYLCNTSVVGDDPRILRSLIEHLYADFHGRGYHFFSLYTDLDDPLLPATRGYFTRSLEFSLYAVSSPTSPRTQFQPGRTGFEMALA